MPTLLNRLKMWRSMALLGLLAAATGQLAEQRMARAGEAALAPGKAPFSTEHACAGYLAAQARQEPIHSTYTTSAIDPQFDPVYAGAGQPGQLPPGVLSGPAPVGPER